MDEKRKGEIALMLVKYKIKKSNIRIIDLKREINRISNSTGICPEELMEFLMEMLF